jgi:hypothetical protein
VTIEPPGFTVTLIAPAGLAQLMFSALSRIGVLSVADTNEPVGSSRDVTIEFEQVSEP